MVSGLPAVRALHETVRTGAKARDAGLFTDVDFSTAEGRATLPESSAVYTPSVAAKNFDTSKALSPLLPFADTSRACSTSRIHPRSRRVPSQRRELRCHGRRKVDCCRKEMALLKRSVQVRRILLRSSFNFRVVGCRYRCRCDITTHSTMVKGRRFSKNVGARRSPRAALAALLVLRGFLYRRMLIRWVLRLEAQECLVASPHAHAAAHSEVFRREQPTVSCFGAHPLAARRPRGSYEQVWKGCGGGGIGLLAKMGRGLRD